MPFVTGSQHNQQPIAWHLLRHIYTYYPEASPISLIFQLKANSAKIIYAGILSPLFVILIRSDVMGSYFSMLPPLA